MAVLNFQKPDKITAQKATDFEGLFEFRPLEPGFGVTIGNALRRVLLSSLEGYAITAVNINNAPHEFATISGVLEDFTEIILNLKQICLKKISKDDDITFEKINLTVSDTDTFRAGDINKFTPHFEVTNPDLVICQMEKGVKLDISLYIQKGRGYVPSEEQVIKQETGYVNLIAIDSIYTPIKNVRYTIENTRVEGYTDFEKLLIEIKTDGTIHPEDAIKEAAKILIQHLMLISDENINFETRAEEDENVVDEQVLVMRKVLKTPLEDLDLSVRAYNCLKAAKINSLQELVQFDANTLIKFRNFGKKSLVEIEEMIKTKGLNFGMDLSKYKIDEE